MVWAAAIVAVIVGAFVIGWVLVVAVTGGPPEWDDSSLVCTQPATVTYESGSSYSVFVRTPTLSMSLSQGPRRAVVGRAGGEYGVFLDLLSTSADGPVVCHWEADAVEIVEPNGVSHRVPATEFTGGR